MSTSGGGCWTASDCHGGAFCSPPGQTVCGGACIPVTNPCNSDSSARPTPALRRSATSFPAAVRRIWRVWPGAPPARNAAKGRAAAPTTTACPPLVAPPARPARRTSSAAPAPAPACGSPAPATANARTPASSVVATIRPALAGSRCPEDCASGLQKQAPGSGGAPFPARTPVAYESRNACGQNTSIDTAGATSGRLALVHALISRVAAAELVTDQLSICELSPVRHLETNIVTRERCY